MKIISSIDNMLEECDENNFYKFELKFNRNNRGCLIVNASAVCCYCDTEYVIAISKGEVLPQFIENPCILESVINVLQDEFLRKIKSHNEVC